MKYLKFTVCQGGKLLGSAPIMEQAIEAAKGYAVKSGALNQLEGSALEAQQLP